MKALKWNDPALLKITQYDLWSDAGEVEWRVVAVTGLNKAQEKVIVEVPWSTVPKAGSVKFHQARGREDGVNPSKLGLFWVMRTWVGEPAPERFRWIYDKG